jgi:hypothetical protein
MYWWERLQKSGRFNRVMTQVEWVTDIGFVLGWTAIAVWVIMRLVS